MFCAAAKLRRNLTLFGTAGNTLGYNSGYCTASYTHGYLRFKSSGSRPARERSRVPNAAGRSSVLAAMLLEARCFRFLNSLVDAIRKLMPKVLHF